MNHIQLRPNNRFRRTPLRAAAEPERSVNNKRKDNVMNWFSRLLGGANNPKQTASLIEAAKADQVEELRNLLAKGVNPNANRTTAEQQ